MNPKKIIALAIVVVVLGLVSYLSLRIIRTETIRKGTAFMPAFTFKTLSGQPFSDDMIGPGYSQLVIDHFSPDCEFCQDMATRIRDRQQLLRNTLIIMITESDSAEVLAFMDKYQLQKATNIIVLRAPALGFYEKFGTATAPCFFVYDGDRRLKKRILGETKIEDLMP